MAIVTGKPAGDTFFDEDGQAGALKVGFLGSGGTGKTYTAALLMCAAKEVLGLPGPLAMYDTETGSIYIRAIIEELTGQKMLVKRARDLQTMVDFGKACVERKVAGAIVDSITHPWRELCESYLAQQNVFRKNKGWQLLQKLEFQHWGPIKAKWALWTDFFLNSPLSIAICGRAGYEYDNETNEETGRKELVKTGVKMKTESEMGYEPSLLVYMESEQDLHADRSKGPIVHRTATILKDRFRDLDGRLKEFKGLGSVKKDYEVVKEFFMPHIERLKGGAHSTINLASKTHFDMGPDGVDSGQAEKREREILCEEIQHAMLAKWPSKSDADKKGKADAIAEIFGRPSWTYVETLDSDTLRKGKERLQRMIAGTPEPGAGSAPIQPRTESDEVPEFATSEGGAPAVPAVPAHATDEQLAQICAVIASAADADQLHSMREELFARREAGTLVLTADQSKQICGAIEEKAALLRAAQPAAAQAAAPAAAPAAAAQPPAPAPDSAVKSDLNQAETIIREVQAKYAHTPTAGQNEHSAQQTLPGAAPIPLDPQSGSYVGQTPIVVGGTGEDHISTICKEIFAIPDTAALLAYREQLQVKRESGELKLTKDQGQRVRQALDGKKQSLEAK